MNAESHTIAFDRPGRELGVVIGFDGSENAIRALHYAASAAIRRRTVLTVATVYRVPAAVYATYAAIPAEPEGEVSKRRAEALLEKAAESLGQYSGEVSYVTTEGDSTGALVELSGKAQLIVVGSRGRGGFFGRLLGSVASALPAHARCPTVVVPIADRQSQAEALTDASNEPVVVGMDESRHSRAAALQAAQEANELGAPLLVLIALPTLESETLWYPQLSPAPRLVEQRKAELQGVLKADITWLKEHFPNVEMSSEVRLGEAVTVLGHAGGAAQLTVVGSRGRGAIASALLGSTSRTLLHKAKWPVMVVPLLVDERMDN